MERIELGHLPILLLDPGKERAYSIAERADVTLVEDKVLGNINVLGTRNETSWSLVYSLSTQSPVAESELRSVPMSRVTRYTPLPPKN